MLTLIDNWQRDEERRLRKKYKFDLNERVYRRYTHFDPRIAPEQIVDILKDPLRVAAHPFLPFLRVHETFRKRALPDTENPDGWWKEKDRPISYAAHSDAYIYSYYAQSLTQLYEEKIANSEVGSSVIAYRKKMNECGDQQSFLQRRFLMK